MTRVHFIAIGIAAILLLIIFGHNPSKYFERKQMESANKNLVFRIMKHNDPNYGKKPKTPPPRVNGIDMGGDTSADKEAVDPSDNPSVGRAYRPPNHYNVNPAVTTMGGNPQYQQQQPRQYQQQIPQQPGPQAQPVAPVGDGYYPPTPPEAHGPQSQLEQPFTKPNALVLSDGRMLAVEGTKVYELSGDGTRKPLKDGKYPLLNNTYTMIIRGGERYVYE